MQEKYRSSGEEQLLAQKQQPQGHCQQEVRTLQREGSSLCLPCGLQDDHQSGTGIFIYSCKLLSRRFLRCLRSVAAALLTLAKRNIQSYVIEPCSKRADT
jgi:hypothetical protein